MAVDLVVGQLYRVTYACRSGDQNGLNIMHYLIDEVGSGLVDDEDLAIALEAKAKPLYKAVLSEFASFYGVKVQLIDSSPPPPQTVISTGGAGTVVGDFLPKQVTGMISLKGELGTRRGRGRKYIPFPSETDWNDGGEFGTDYQTALAALAPLFGSTQTFSIGGVTVKIGGCLYNPDLFPQTVRIVSVVPRKYSCTMRSRNPITGGDGVPW